MGKEWQRHARQGPGPPRDHSKAKLLLTSQAFQPQLCTPSHVSPSTDLIRPALPMQPLRSAKADFMAQSHGECEWTGDGSAYFWRRCFCLSLRRTFFFLFPSSGFVSQKECKCIKTKLFDCTKLFDYTKTLPLHTSLSALTKHSFSYKAAKTLPCGLDGVWLSALMWTNLKLDPRGL